MMHQPGDATASGGGPALHVPYHAWRQRLHVLSRAIRRLRPHAHSHTHRPHARGDAWNPFSSADTSPSSSPASATAAASSSSWSSSPLLTQRFSTDEDMVAAIQREFEQLLLGLRLDTRLCDSPHARVAEAQTLLCRAAFYREVQLHLNEKQRRAATASSASPQASPSLGSAPTSSFFSSFGIGGTGEGLQSTEARHRRRRARYAQQLRHYICAEAHDYLSSARLWLGMERERRDMGVPSMDDALAYGVLACATACGTLLRAEVREEESPIPLSLYDKAAKAFHLCHEQTEPMVDVGGLRGYAGVPGHGNVEALLDAFPGEPIPAAWGGRPRHGAGARPSASSSCSPPGHPPNDAEPTDPTPDASRPRDEPVQFPSYFVAWDDFPPTAHHRYIHLVHSLLMGLADTLATTFACYELAVNYYELAAVVLLESVPQWMWRWDEHEKEEEEEEDVGVDTEEEKEKDDDRNAAKTSTQEQRHLARSPADAVRRQLHQLAPSTRASAASRAQQEEPASLFSIMLQQAQRYREAPILASSPRAPETDTAAAPSSSTCSPSREQPQQRQAQGQRVANITQYLQTASDARLHAGGTLRPYLQAIRKAAEVAVVVGDSARALLFVNNGLRVMQTSELIRFDTLALFPCHEAEDTATAECAVPRANREGMSTARHVDATGTVEKDGSRRTRVRLAHVDERRSWPQTRQPHAAFRRDTVNDCIVFHLTRILVLLDAASDEVDVHRRTEGSTAPTTPQGPMKEPHASSESSSTRGEMRDTDPQPASVLHYAASALSSIDALAALAKEVRALEGSSMTLGCRVDVNSSETETGGRQAGNRLRGMHETQMRPLRLLGVVSACDSSTAATTKASLTSADPGERADGAKPTTLPTAATPAPEDAFMHTVVYQTFKKRVLDNARRQQQWRHTQQRAREEAEVRELSSDSSDSDDDAARALQGAGHRVEASEDAPSPSSKDIKDHPVNSTSLSFNLESLAQTLRVILAVTEQPIPFDTTLSVPCSGATSASAPTPSASLYSFASARATSKFFESQLQRIEGHMSDMGIGSRAVLMLVQRLRRKRLYPAWATAPLFFTGRKNGE